MLIDYPWQAARRGAPRPWSRTSAARCQCATGIEVRTACASTSIIRARHTFSPRVLVLRRSPRSPLCRSFRSVLSEARAENYFGNDSLVAFDRPRWRSISRFATKIGSIFDKTQLVFERKNYWPYSQCTMMTFLLYLHHRYARTSLKCQSELDALSTRGSLKHSNQYMISIG